MRTTAIETLSELVAEGFPVHLLTADLGFGVLDRYRERHPDQFTNVGVAEANMIGIAAGMATRGFRPFCYSMVPFLMMRAFEQVRMDLCVQNLPVTLIGVGGGLCYGFEGPSHFAIEDVALARSLPNLTVLAPGDPWEARAAVRFAAGHTGPVYIRLGKNNDPAVHASMPSRIDRALPVVSGDGRCLAIASGHILHNAVQAVKRLEASGVRAALWSAPMVKPFDRETIVSNVQKATLVVTVEEHSIIGGLGTVVAEILLASGYRGRFLKIGLPDRYPDEVGRHEYLQHTYGLNPDGIAERILSELRKS